MMILQVILEGIGLGVLLILVCAIGIRKGAVGMVHLYSQEVQERMALSPLCRGSSMRLCARPKNHQQGNGPSGSSPIE